MEAHKSGFSCIYKDNVFRSKLEKNYAIIFDAMNIKWEYEVKKINLLGMVYIPDFYFPELNTYFEVKGLLDDFDLYKVTALSVKENVNVILGTQWYIGGVINNNFYDIRTEKKIYNIYSKSKKMREHIIDVLKQVIYKNKVKENKIYHSKFIRTYNILEDLLEKNNIEYQKGFNIKIDEYDDNIKADYYLPQSDQIIFLIGNRKWELEKCDPLFLTKIHMKYRSEVVFLTYDGFAGGIKTYHIKDKEKKAIHSPSFAQLKRCDTCGAVSIDYTTGINLYNGNEIGEDFYNSKNTFIYKNCNYCLSQWFDNHSGIKNDGMAWGIAWEWIPHYYKQRMIYKEVPISLY